MTKRIMSVVLATLLILSVIPFVFAVGTPAFTVSSATASQGETVNLKVLISNNPGINTFSLGFDYDTSRLSLESVEKSFNMPGQFQYSKKAVWLNSSDSTYNGEALNLVFSVLEDAVPGDAFVAVTYNSGDISNYNEEDVDFDLVAGKVTIPDNGVQAAGTITVGTETASPGSEAAVSVYMSNNPGINTFSLGFDYDTSRLSLKSVEKSEALPGQFQYSRKAVWLNSGDTDYNGEILILTFDVLEDAAEGDAYVTVTCNSGDISNYAEDDVEFNLVAGKLTIVPANDSKITVASVVAQSGDEIDVPVTMENNPGVIGVGLSVSYDEALTLISVTDGGILGAAMHSDNYTKNPYYLNWANDTATENITANGVIATLTFKVADDAEDGEYAVWVSYDNDDFEIFNYDAETVDFTLEAGKVLVKNYMIGDLDGNGRVNAQDRLILNRYIAKWDGYAEMIVDMRAADIDGNGKVNAQDRLILSRYIAKWDGYSSYFEG